MIQTMMNPTYSVEVYGNSMEPLFSEGDDLVINEIKNINDLNINDVVLYESGDKKILHRVLYAGEDIDGDYVIVKGDANDCPDGFACWLEDDKTKSIAFKIRLNQIIGKV